MSNTHIRAGEFDQRVTIMKAPAISAQRDAYGAINQGAQTQTPLRTVWAQISPVRGYEVRESGREISALFTTISIPYQSAKDVDDTMSILHIASGQVYDIRNVSHVDTGRKLIELTCRVINPGASAA